MYIKDIFDKKNPVISFEVFPPKKDSGFDKVKSAVERLSKSNVDYISVTYGAGGSTSKKTGEIASYIQDELDTVSLAHLTCVSATKSEIHSKLEEFKSLGIKNILALRGDIPSDSEFPNPMQYKYASELVADIKAFGGFCIGGACYPEGHPNSETVDEDIENLKIKVDAGCEFLVTQLFFDNELFYDFKNKCVQKGINVPITAGIMPITAASQIQKMCSLSGGAVMPRKFTRMFAKYQDDPEALKQAGIAYAVDQIIDLLSNDSHGIHIYTMNKPDVAEKIVGSISHLLK